MVRFWDSISPLERVRFEDSLWERFRSQTVDHVIGHNVDVPRNAAGGIDGDRHRA